MKESIAAVVLLAAVVTGCQHQTGSPGPSTATGSRSASPSAGSALAARNLNQPGSLAAGPTGVLFIADDSRNMIFARYSNGQIHPVAGTGVRGFSGDGQPATAARLNDPAGMAYDRMTGSLYFADAGNNRVRVIDRSGIIRTVAGSGRTGWVSGAAHATSAPLTGPTAVALSPDGDAYIACAGEILRLDRSGRVTRIAGVRSSAGISGIGGPALHAAIDSANGLGFDRHGDLYLTGFATKGLLVITPDQRMREICSSCLYPRGNGGIVTAYDGSVLVMGSQQIYRYTSPTRHTMLVNFAGHKPVDGVTAIAPNGLAVAPNNTIFLDTNVGNGFTNATTLIALNPRTARPTVVWKR